MRRSAKVLEIINDNTAKVLIHKFEKYKQMGPDGKQMYPDSIYEAHNPVQAKEGEIVEVEIKKQLSAADLTFTYILPILAFVAGMLLTGVYFADEVLKPVVSIFVALASVGATMMVGSVYKTQNPSVYIFTIVNRIEPAESK